MEGKGVVKKQGAVQADKKAVEAAERRILEEGLKETLRRASMANRENRLKRS